MPAALRSVAGAAAIGVSGVLYGALVEPRLFTLRSFAAPVLDPGTPAVRVLHLSDLHLTAGQGRKQAWISGLARLKPDLVINTGDHFSDPDAIPEILSALGPLFDFPGAFVPGNNDYFVPKPRNPFDYLRGGKLPDLSTRTRMPWPELASAMSGRGWLDLTHHREQVTVAGVPVALAGLDDPHLRKARYSLIRGEADSSAAVRIGVMHSPEPALLGCFAADGYDLVLAGHTHGGQIRVPFGPALVTNSGIDVHRARWLHAWDDRMWFNVCAGLGTNPYMPIRFACRPEAVLLTLLPRDRPLAI